MPSSCHVYTQNILQIFIGCPSVLRMDRGTENTKVAALQYAFREDGTDEYAGIKSVPFGTCPVNCLPGLRNPELLIPPVTITSLVYVYGGRARQGQDPNCAVEGRSTGRATHPPALTRHYHGIMRWRKRRKQ